MRVKNIFKVVCVVLATSGAQLAIAEKFPSQPIKIVLGFGPGGGADGIARLYAQKLSQVFNSPVIVENKPGAYEQVAGQTVASAKPDGYTLWLTTSGGAIQAPLIRKMPYSAQKSFVPVGVIANADAVIALKKSSPLQSIDEFIKFARNNPNAINYGSAGTGAPSHLLMEYIQVVTNTTMTHIPFKSAADVVRELAAGTIDVAVAVPASAVPMIQDSRVKAIAVTAPIRMKALPDTPTLVEGGVAELKGMAVYSLYGVLAPAGTPAEKVKILNDALNKISSDADVQKKAESMHFRPVSGTPEEFTARMVRESAQWEVVAKKLR